MEHTNFVILSDFLSAIGSIKNKTNPNEIIVLIQNKLEEAKTYKKQIVIIWIPGHAGINSNETADKYAKLTVFKTETTVIDQILFEDFKNSVKTHIREKWRIHSGTDRTQTQTISREQPLDG